jgi:hypothetical protein
MPWEEVTDPTEIAVAEGMVGDTVPTREELLRKQALGLPVLRAERNPVYGIRDPKQRAMAQTQALGVAEKAADKAQPAAQQRQDTLRDLLEFEELNRKYFPGFWSPKIAAELPSAMISADQQRAQMLASGMARGQRVPGEGTVSDFDAAQFLKMTGGLAMDKATNEKFVKAQKAALELADEKQRFREAFVQANGTLQGVETLWKQYTNANTIFDKSGNLNSNRQSWADYYASRAQKALRGENPDAPARRAAPPARTAPPSSGDKRPPLGQFVRR